LALIASIVENSDDAIISKTLDGVISSWNPAAERMFGYTAEEAIGQPITMIIPEDRRDEEQQIIGAIRRGERVDHMEVVRVGKDGRQIELSLTVSPIRDDAGQIVGASKIARDISERRRVIAALRDADRRKDEFLATLAHELRNPLAPISSAIEILKVARDDPETSANALAIMDRQVSQMVRLVDDLLDVARISTGKVEIRKRRIDLAAAVKNAIETSLPLIDRAGQTLRVQEPPEPIYVDGDKTRLAQVFANLLNNSSKYSDRGQAIELRISKRDGLAVVTIKDSGIGIPAEALPRVFDMFSQADRSIGRSQGGLGIGLFLVRRVVDMHGGAVEARSDGPGCGSEFTVRLPTVESKEIETSADEDTAIPAAKKRVLVVDDNEDGAEALATHLRIKGHDVRAAFDGAEAVAAAEAFRPDVMFIDLGMPTLDGHEAAKQIRSRPWGRKVLLVALTGWGQTEDRKRSHQAGFDHHIVKPADPEVIARLINTERVL
jgi:PAS domain S-box-containing protein